jgi:hypothetical protein
MKLSVLRSLSVAILSVSVSLVSVLSLYGHTCYENQTNVNCSSSQENPFNTCVNCTVPGVPCSQNTGKDYSDATNVYRYETVAIGAGTIRKTSETGVDKKCWDEFQCTNTVRTDWKCLSSGCSDQNASGMYCNECGQGALIPNNGHYWVWETEECNLGS